jgi:hypothetical protein
MIWKREPALFYGVVNAAIALAVSFGLDLKPDQIGALLAVTSALLALLTRTQMTANVKLPGPTPDPVPPCGEPGLVNPDA